jgi:hypothetical protein
LAIPAFFDIGVAKVAMIGKWARPFSTEVA